MSNRSILRRWPALSALVAFAATSAAAAPTIQVEPSAIDLGVIQAGNVFERFVEVTNAGDGTLVIEDVQTSCGCTAASVDGVVELGPGVTQKVRVTFDSKDMDGTIKKNVTIKTNDPEMPAFIVELHADVHQSVRWLPKYLAVSRIGKSVYDETVELQSDTNLDLKVTSARILGGTLKDNESRIFDLVADPRQEVGERYVHRFHVKLHDDAKPQKISETLEVVTNQPAPNDVLKFPIRGEISGRIRVVPSFAVLRMVESGQETDRDLTLTATEGTFKVLSAEVEGSPVKVEVHPDDTGKQTVIRLLYTGEEPGTQGVRTLLVKTDDPDQPMIEVPVRYQTRAAPTTSSAAASGK
jgi:hypothetical protein